MRLPEFSINRPVTTSMFFIGALLLGFISLTHLPRELFPSITYPQLTIVTTYENAAPEEVETLITKIIEETAGTVSNLKRISSISKEGISVVTAEFNWGTNMDFASLGVREKIDLIKERLPLGSADPIVMKFNPFEFPVITLSVTGEEHPSELLSLSRRFIKDELEKIEGVASCNIRGGLEREILVSVDEGRLRASHISIIEVVDALRSSNLNYPAGTIEEYFYDYLIRTMGEFKIVPEIKGTIVAKDKSEREDILTQGQPFELEEDKARLIFLKDIAEIKDVFQEKTSISRYNGKENISIAVQKQAGVNTLRVAQKIRNRLKEIERDLPRGTNINIVYDQSIFIKKSIQGVMQAAIQGGFLAFLVLLIFIRNIKASLIVAFSMPVSIMVAFSLMYFNGITLNMLSLGGLALGIGMLVDNAIVVIENIYIHLQKKEDIREASKSGAGEMSRAIFASTLTTVAVFLPMVFVVGVAGQLFRELAFTVTFSLLSSLVAALSLVPLLSAIGPAGSSRLRDGSMTTFTFGIGPLYSKLIPGILKYRWLFLIAILMVFIFSMGLILLLDKEFMPKVDQREFIMKVNMPSGTKLEVTDKVVRDIEDVLLGMKEIDGVAVDIGSNRKKDYAQGIETIGSNQSQIIVSLKKGKKAIPTHKLIEELKHRLDRMNLEASEIEYVLQESIFKTALQGAAPIVIEIKGKDLNKIEEISEYVKDGLAGIEGIYGIRTSLTRPSPETKVNVLKDKAALYNLSTGMIAQAAHTAIKGIVATKFKEEGEEIDIRVRLRKESRSRLSHIRNLLVHSPLDIEVPLSEVAYITQGVGPSEIKRLDQQRVVLVTANIADRPLNRVIMDIEALITGIEEKDIMASRNIKDEERDLTVSLSGESQEMQESFRSLRFALLLSILLVYMIMASEFESLWQPFIIMFTVPLSIIGVLAVLAITHTPISVVVILGVIILAGIVVNNGIILIDSINTLRERGVELIEAVIESGRTRLRPILMTSMTTVLGLLPLALGIAEGAEIQSPMAITVMGGLTVSTILTLFVIPCIYTVVAGDIAGRPALKVVPVQEDKPVLTPPLASIEVQAVKPKIKPFIIRADSERGEVIPLPAPAVSEPQLTKPEEPVRMPEEPAAEPESARLNRRQEQVLEHLKQARRITRKEYAQLFNISVPTAARDLRELLDMGLVVAHGPLGPGRWYELK